MQPDTKWTSRVSQQAHAQHHKQAFHHARSSLGHIIREAGILAPLIISEFVKDNDKRWRYIRMASVGTALFSEAAYAIGVHQRREEAKAREAERCPG